MEGLCKINFISCHEVSAQVTPDILQVGNLKNQYIFSINSEAWKRDFIFDLLSEIIFMACQHHN